MDTRHNDQQQCRRFCCGVTDCWTRWLFLCYRNQILSSHCPEKKRRRLPGADCYSCEASSWSHGCRKFRRNGCAGWYLLFNSNLPKSHFNRLNLQGKTVAVLTGGTWAVLADPSAGTVNTAGGLGLFEAPYMLDAQCSDQGREGRLIRMLQNYRNTPTIGTTRGLCIDGDHALVVTDLCTQPTGTVISYKSVI